MTLHKGQTGDLNNTILNNAKNSYQSPDSQNYVTFRPKQSGLFEFHFSTLKKNNMSNGGKK